MVVTNEKKHTLKSEFANRRRGDRRQNPVDHRTSSAFEGRIDPATVKIDPGKVIRRRRHHAQPVSLAAFLAQAITQHSLPPRRTSKTEHATFVVGRYR